MAKGRKDVCPGCSRHCSLNHVRCKYGQKYIEKIRKADADSHHAPESKRHYKWEKLVAQGGLAWKLLWVSSRSKKALRRKQLTEQELLSALDDAAQAQLNAILDQLLDRLG